MYVCVLIWKCVHVLDGNAQPHYNDWYKSVDVAVVADVVVVLIVAVTIVKPIQSVDLVRLVYPAEPLNSSAMWEFHF